MVDVLVQDALGDVPQFMDGRGHQVRFNGPLGSAARPVVRTAGSCSSRRAS